VDSYAESSMQTTESLENQIEIVRNVRPGYSEQPQPPMPEPSMQEAAPQEPAPADPQIVMPLLPNAHGRPDFQGLWDALAPRLQTTPSPQVAIDLQHIAAFDQREIGYLDKLCQIIQQRNGTVILFQCRPELLNVIGNNPSLASLVQH
jgi:hypothetical protein